MELIRRGDLVRDTITGLEGVVTIKSIYLNGCVQFGIKSNKLKDGKPFDTEYVDAPQLEVVKRAVVPATFTVYDPEGPGGADVPDGASGQEGPGGPSHKIPPREHP